MNLYRKELNKTSDTTLVLLHGNSSSSKVFAPLIKNNTISANIIAFDLPGHGKSKAIQQFDLDVLIALLIKEINALNTKIVLLGHSLGGHLCLEISEKIVALKGLILMGTPPLAKPLNLEECFFPIPELNTYFTENPTEEEVDKAICIAVNQKRVIPGIKEDFLNTAPLFRKTMHHNFIEEKKIADEQLIFNNLAIPKFIIHGKNDTLINFDYFIRLKKENKLGSVKIYEIEDCGHYPSIEKPHEFQKIIVDIFNLNKN